MTSITTPMHAHDDYYTTPYGESETPRAIRERARRRARAANGGQPVQLSIDPGLLGHRLRRARLAAGLTRPQLAQLVGMRNTAGTCIGRYERGTSRPRWPRLERLAEVLATTPERLLTGRR